MKKTLPEPKYSQEVEPLGLNVIRVRSGLRSGIRRRATGIRFLRAVRGIRLSTIRIIKP